MAGNADEVIRRLHEEPPGNDRCFFANVALICASWKGHEDLVRRLLIEGGADPLYQFQTGQTALMFAARWGRLRIVETLVEYGAAVGQADSRGEVAADYASRGGFTELAEMLRN